MNGKIQHPDPACNPPPTREEIAAAVGVIVKLLSALAAPTPVPAAAEFIYTGDPPDTLRGHTRRALEDRIRAHELVAVKTSGRGYRIAISDLTAWETAHAAKRARRTRKAAPEQPANDAAAASRSRLAAVGGVARAGGR